MMRSRIRWMLLVIAGLWLTSVAVGARSAAAPVDLTPESLRALVEAELTRFAVPGASVAVVRDGKILFVEGFGLRNVAKREPMTAATVQPIASITKSFTVSALATLARDGKLQWDRPVIEYLPDFRLYDDARTYAVTVRDLVTHRTGLPRHDAAWFGSSATREEFFARLRYFEPNAPLRQTWQYNNFMFMSAGLLGGRLAGTSWERFVQATVFEPLGMKSASTRVADLLAQPDHGTAYLPDDDGRPVETRYTPLDAMGPTGSINASARDMAQYLLMLTNGGKLGDKVIVPAADLAAMTSPQMVLPDDRRWPEVSPRQYGMGFFVGQYRGIRYFEHGGNMPGSASALRVFPEQRLGIFVSANLSGTMLRDALPLMLADRLLGLEPVDWAARLKAEESAIRAAEKDARARRIDPRKLGTKPAHAFEDYVGDYVHAGYGMLSVTRGTVAERPLVFNYNGNASPMEHFHFEVFKVPDDKTNEWEGTKVQFVTAQDGDVTGVESTLQSGVAPIRFTKLPEARLADPNYLRRFTGTYAVGTVRATISLRGDGVLTMAFTGQPPAPLRGLRGTRFSIEGQPGVTLLFIESANGKVDEVAYLSEAGGNAIAKRVQ
jgi:CubicO group peptidase (beta-lactamase class C family)